MAVYIYTQETIEQITRARQRQRRRFCAVVSIILIAAVVVAGTRPEWIFGANQHARLWVLTALFVFFAGPLGDNLLRGKRRHAKLRQTLSETHVETSDAGIRYSAPQYVRSMSWQEVVRAEEVPWGVYLRTRNRYRWLMISNKVGGFDSLTREITGMNIPIVQTASAPNWEEFAGMLVFTATILCAIFAQSVAWLAVNLALALIISVAGFLIISANPDNLPKMRWARLGIFLPVAMTATMLWTKLRV